MSDHVADRTADQRGLFEPEAERALLDQLLADSRLYSTTKDYKDLLDFVVRLRNFAPFNAMLLQVQKPGLTYAASATDWAERFGRYPKEGARPLIILWPFGPVALVYDVLDTDGKELPRDVASFFARGAIQESQFLSFEVSLGRKGIEWRHIDAGDASAGAIRLMQRATDEKDFSLYRMLVNRNHSVAVRFVTLAHELAHLFLGHLGADKKLSVPKRAFLTHAQQELEAESVAYLVCSRNGVESTSQTYLANYVKANTTVEDIDFYQVMRASGQVESILCLSALGPRGIK